MILDEDTDPLSKKQKPRALDKLSVPELKDYLQQLKNEILRVEEDLRKKEKSKSAADAFFKT
jgi:uncharacterized small protein (DUF1192 family)